MLGITVLHLSELTKLSNGGHMAEAAENVLHLSELTKLSNKIHTSDASGMVLHLSELTKLSNSGRTLLKFRWFYIFLN